MATASPTSALVKKMCKETSPYRHFDIDILNFAHSVWGLDRSIGQKILDMDIKLDPRKLYAYRRSKCEKELRAPFIEFSKHLLREVASRLGVPAEDISDCFWDMADVEAQSYVPDMITTWRTQHTSISEDHTLCIAKQILEFSHEDFKDTGSFLSHRQRARLMRTVNSVSKLLRKPNSIRPREVNSEPKFESEIPSNDPHDTVDFRNRKRRHESDSSFDSGRAAKRPRSHRGAQLASHAVECLAATARRWITGLFVDTCQVTACYFDRHLVACSSSLRFDQKPTTLAVMLYAMNVCTKDRAGFDPHLLSSPLPPTTLNAGRRDPALPVSQMVGSVFYFSITAKDNSTGFEESLPITQLGNEHMNKKDRRRSEEEGCPTIDETVRRDAREGRNSEMLHGLVKRPRDCRKGGKEPRDEPNATPVSDGKDSQGTPVKDSACFRIVNVIRKPDELVSRATGVFKVRWRLPNGEFSDGLYALKLSWPPTTRASEIDVIKHLKNALPESSHDHLPQLVFSRTWTAEQLALPWLDLKLRLSKENHEERVLRVLASRHYEKLWEAGSIENFKQAWLDCVEVCHLAYRTGRVLHRDLSENNLMVLSLPDGTVKGVLNDWDMAMFIRDTDRHTPCLYRTGTPPFMAMDLLQAEALNLPEMDVALSPPHWFRHDLESLVCILIWGALHYNLATRERDTEVNRIVEPWTKNATSNLGSKIAFFNGGKAVEDSLLKQVKPGFEGIAKDWIKPLRRLFKKAMLFGDAAEKDGLEGYDPSTYGGQLTFEKFMKAINVTPRTWGIPNFLEQDS